MFSQIKTNSKNKENVVELTRKFNLGAENIIARIAIAYSLQSGVKFSPLDIKDSGGKEYSKNVLFGNYYSIYIAMICTHYQISDNDKDIPRYLKIHLDDGLERIAQDVKDNPNLVGYDYLFDKIHKGLEDMIC
ncbi:DndE family protein [uncultured Bacteroides sp.]|uniref:DndE family protein n=1 Tax=uncultured Bacteroides sp. TaxID=162156 RepID=UPI0025EB1A3D|nr:DndE family protein [uncultured Bacteroides sp.]